MTTTDTLNAPVACGFKALDEMFYACGLPLGALVEVWSAEARNTLWFATHWAKAAESQGGISLWVDPFGEVEWDLLLRAGLNTARSIQLTVEEPHALARALIRLIEKRMANLVIIPAGVVGQHWLHGERPDADASERQLRELFEQTLGALSWAARQCETTILVLREVKAPERTHPLSSHVRLRMEPTAGSDRRQSIIVDHHALAGEWVGRRLEL